MSVIVDTSLSGDSMVYVIVFDVSPSTTIATSYVPSSAFGTVTLTVSADHDVYEPASVDENITVDSP